MGCHQNRVFFFSLYHLLCTIWKNISESVIRYWGWFFLSQKTFQTISYLETTHSGDCSVSSIPLVRKSKASSTESVRSARKSVPVAVDINPCTLNVRLRCTARPRAMSNPKRPTAARSSSTTGSDGASTPTTDQKKDGQWPVFLYAAIERLSLLSSC